VEAAKLKLAAQSKNAKTAAKPAGSEHDFSLRDHMASTTGSLTASELEFRSRRIATLNADFRTLSFSLFGARIFFRTDDEDLERALRATERIRAAAQN
jgi:hypothetical protein